MVQRPPESRVRGRRLAGPTDGEPPVLHWGRAIVSLSGAFTEPAVSIKARQYGDLFRRYIVPQLPFVVTLGVLLFVSLGMQLALPLIIRHFIDEAQEGAPLSILTSSASAFIAIRHLLLGAGGLDGHEQYPRGPGRARPVAGHVVPQRPDPGGDDRAGGR